MDGLQVLFDKGLKAQTKMALLSSALLEDDLTPDELIALASGLKDPALALLLSAIEAATQKRPEIASESLLHFVQERINAKSNSLKRAR